MNLEFGRIFSYNDTACSLRRHANIFEPPHIVQIQRLDYEKKLQEKSEAKYHENALAKSFETSPNMK